MAQGTDVLHDLLTPWMRVFEMTGFHSSSDDLRLLAIMRIASNRCGGHSWESIESGLREDWEVLRASDSYPWHEVANRLRTYCEDYGLVK